MLTGHVAFSYLLSITPMVFGFSLTKIEQGFIILCGIILDIDFIIPYFTKKEGAMHHFLPTHTPLFCFILMAIFYSLFNKYMSLLTFLFGFLALIFHLILDDIGYWIYKMKIDKKFKRPQIFWLYPFDTRRTYWLKKVNMTNKEAVHFFFKEPYTWKIEVFLVAVSIIIFCIWRLTT
jgi:hypothetical protein